MDQGDDGLGHRRVTTWTKTVDTVWVPWKTLLMTNNAFTARSVLDTIIDGHEDAADAIFDYLIDDGKRGIADLGTALGNVVLMAIESLEEDELAQFRVSMEVCPNHHMPLEDCSINDDVRLACRDLRRRLAPLT